MHDGPACTLECVDGPADQVLASLRQHLDGDVVGDVVAFDEQADEVEVGLRGGREGDLDLLETDLAERLEHAHLALGVHRLEKRLVAVAQIGAHPDRRRGERATRPLPISELERREGRVFECGIVQHDRGLLGVE
jgi:hypothetical protein